MRVISVCCVAIVAVTAGAKAAQPDAAAGNPCASFSRRCAEAGELVRRGRREEARQAYREAMAQAREHACPPGEGGFDGMAVVTLFAGPADPRSAAAACDFVLQAHPTGQIRLEALLTKAGAHLALGERATADGICRGIIRDLPDDATAGPVLCRIGTVVGFKEEIASKCEAIIGESTDHVATYRERNMVELIRRYGDGGRAPINLYIPTEWRSMTPAARLAVYNRILARYPACRLAPYIRFLRASLYHASANAVSPGTQAGGAVRRAARMRQAAVRDYEWLMGGGGSGARFPASWPGEDGLVGYRIGGSIQAVAVCRMGQLHAAVDPLRAQSYFGWAMTKAVEGVDCHGDPYGLLARLDCLAMWLGGPVSLLPPRAVETIAVEVLEWKGSGGRWEGKTRAIGLRRLAEFHSRTGERQRAMDEWRGFFGQPGTGTPDTVREFLGDAVGARAAWGESAKLTGKTFPVETRMAAHAVRSDYLIASGAGVKAALLELRRMEAIGGDGGQAPKGGDGAFVARARRRALVLAAYLRLIGDRPDRGRIQQACAGGRNTALLGVLFEQARWCRSNLDWWKRSLARGGPLRKPGGPGLVTLVAWHYLSGGDCDDFLLFLLEAYPQQVAPEVVRLVRAARGDAGVLAGRQLGRMLRHRHPDLLDELLAGEPGGGKRPGRKEPGTRIRAAKKG
ncbi:MAG: hypothetical protein AAB152_01695 [Candidatus Coatesbacteria bacterium]|mgnify:CR=1 FL=1